MINKKTLSEQVYSMIKMDILKNKIKEGDILVNKDLQDRFGVSSSPVRDAINHLNSDGLISNINRSGAEVITIDKKKVREINELMSTITGGAIWLCKSNGIHSKELIMELKKYSDLQKRHLDDDKYFYYDYCFHKIFFNYSGNSELKKIYNQYSVLFEMAVRSLHRKKDSKELRLLAYNQHKVIIDSLLTESVPHIIEKIIEHYKSATINFEDIDLD